MKEQKIDVDLEPEPLYKVGRILKWRKVRVGRRSTREFWVTWRGYPLDEAQWILRLILYIQHYFDNSCKSTAQWKI